MRRFSIVFGAFVTISIFVFVAVTTRQSDRSLPAEIIMMTALVPGCGNEIIETGEECDGTALAQATCQTKGFSSGVLSCTQSCTFNTTACVATTNGGGSGGIREMGAQVIFAGSAYPTSKVTLLKDSQLITTTIADDLAHFQVSVSGLSAGMYTFALYSEDSKGNRSAIRTFPVTLTKNVLNKIDSIFLAPTLSGDKTEVRRGDPIIFFGQSAPRAQVTLEVHSDQPYFVNVPAARDGVYFYTFDSAPLELGQHAAQSRSATGTIMSPQSTAYGFTVGTKNVYGSSTALGCPKKGDVNRDCRVNLVDFSIAAFWYQQKLSPAFAVREKTYLNGDGKITLIDFSIMAFYWTG